MAQVDYAALKKGGFMRQKQKGYFSLRIQVVGGNLTAENIKAVSEVAEQYGKGYVHMTSRQGIEIPFIRFEVLILIPWHRNLMSIILDGNCRTNSNLV